MAVNLIVEKRIRIKAARWAKHPFLGYYDYHGMLASRPYYLQENPGKQNPAQQKQPMAMGDDSGLCEGIDDILDGFMLPEVNNILPLPPRYALWYSDELSQWVITEDFRLLDCLVVDARSSDSAWFPWDISLGWEVATESTDQDPDGKFVSDRYLRVRSANNRNVSKEKSERSPSKIERDSSKEKTTPRTTQE